MYAYRQCSDSTVHQRRKELKYSEAGGMLVMATLSQLVCHQLDIHGLDNTEL
jgi:hypothetical protein